MASVPEGLFAGATPLALQRLVARHTGWLLAGDRRAPRRAMQFGVLAWAPLAALVLAQRFILGGDDLASFLHDFGAHARFLVALPLLILAERASVPRLESLAKHLVARGHVVEHDLPQFDDALAALVRLRDSALARLIIIVLAFAGSVLLAFDERAQDLPQWNYSAAGQPHLSLAGVWHIAVSIPLLLALLFGWAWRWLRWARFLWVVARLRLRLVAAHPDRLAGLRYLTYSMAYCWPVATALGAVMAGAVANAVLVRGLPMERFQLAIVMLVVLILFAGVAPLLVFAPRLFTCWRRAVFDYGTLAEDVGREFERSWLGPDRKALAEALETQAFSATTDLYSVVANVFSMRIVLIDLRCVAVLVVATLLPFAPVALAVAPVDVWLEKLLKLMV